MKTRIAVLVVVLLAFGAGSLTSAACAAPQASKLAWIGEPTEPDDYGEPDEPSLPSGVIRGDASEPSEGLIHGDPGQPDDGLVRQFLAWIARVTSVLHS